MLKRRLPSRCSPLLSLPSSALRRRMPLPPRPRVVRISGGVAAGNILTKVQPVYPQDAKEQHIGRSVVMHARIDTAGNIADLEVVSGPEVLRASALEAVKQWTYKPYVLNGRPVDIDTTITVNYSFGE